MRGDIMLFLGLVTLVVGGVIAAVIFLFGGGGGGESSVCDQPLPPRGQSEVSEMGFQAEDDGLARVIDAASAEDIPAAHEAFFGDVRSFTYDIDQPLREVDEGLAKELCEAVNKMEEELTVNQHADQVAIQARRIRELLREAAEALGYDRLGE